MWLFARDYATHDVHDIGSEFNQPAAGEAIAHINGMDGALFCSRNHFRHPTKRDVRGGAQGLQFHCTACKIGGEYGIPPKNAIMIDISAPELGIIAKSWWG